jgi:hypothetical protein
MMRRWLPELLGLSIACALVGASLRAQSQGGGYSRHCPVDKEAGKLAAASYKGSFSAMFFAEGGAAQGNMSLMMRVHGPLELEPLGGKVDGVKGNVDYFLGGAGMAAPVMLLGLNFSGEGELARDGASSEDRFDAMAYLSIKGGASARAPNGQAKRSGAAGGAIHLNFVIDQSTCDVASGRFTSPEILKSADALSAKGFTVSKYHGTWQVSSGGDSAKKQQKLLEELSKTPPKGIVRTREAEARRLGKIADDIKREQPEVRDCLIRIWLQHVRKLNASWIQEDAAKIKAYKGDAAGLDELICRGLEADRSLAQVGMDQCEEALHEKLWDAIAGKLSDVLARMAKQQAPLRDILQVLRNAELLGAVSPALEEQVAAAIVDQAKKLADAYFAALKRAATAHKKDGCNPEVRKAAAQALHVEHQYELLGGSDDGRLLSYLAGLGCGGSK